MKRPRYEDHGSPVRRARETARRRLPCPGCGAGGEPLVRRPRYLSDAWRRDPDAFYGCGNCGYPLAVIEGPAADRPSELMIDHVPDPEGALHAVLARDPSAIRHLVTGETPPPIRLGETMGPQMSGIEVRGRVAMRLPGGLVSTAPLVLVRHGIPWVVAQVVVVDEILDVPAGIADRSVSDLLRVPTVEAAFTVEIDRHDRWYLRSLGPG